MVPDTKLIAMENLDLTFFNTGEGQHVFIKTKREDGWVYKLPAAFGYILPFDHEHRRFKPKNSWGRILKKVFERLPRFLDRKFEEKNSPRKLITVYRKSGENLLAFYYRKKTLLHFRKMLRILDGLSQSDSRDDLLPFEIIKTGSAVLRVNGEKINYKGPIMKQKKADFFFNNSHNFSLFEWSEVVEIQHRLWKNGFAFLSMGEILGPKNWAMLGGKIYIADTNMITDDYEKARRMLSAEKMEKKEKQVFERLESAECKRLAPAYFRFVRNEINREKFDELWKTNVQKLKANGTRILRQSDSNF